MNTLFKILSASLVITLVFVSEGSAQRIKHNIESLRGLKGIMMAIEDLKPDIEEDGLSQEKIQTDVELKLRLAGIIVLDDNGWLNEPGQPYLYVNINSKKNNAAGIYAFNIGVSLKQNVIIARVPELLISTETWQAENVGYISVKNAAGMRDLIKDVVDIFINDFLAVNTK
ncbi:hypothetical protein ACFL2X_06495 [Candidatus Latescibacterota bacterium]